MMNDECNEMDGRALAADQWESEIIPIIADGGVKCNGDIAKALVAGANMVMAGGLFASCSDSPAETIKMDGKIYKAYFGSASAQNKGHNNHIEGTFPQKRQEQVFAQGLFWWIDKGCQK